MSLERTDHRAYARCSKRGSRIQGGGGTDTSSGPSSGGAATSSGAGGASSSSTSTSSTSGGGSDPFDAGGCTQGQACGDGGVCAGDTCCDPSLACAKACCTAGQICSFQACETPGATCVDTTDCAADSYCDLSLGAPGGMDGGAGGGSCMGGASQPTGKCLKKPPECPPGMPSGDPITCLSKCEYKPPTSDFTVVQKQYWGGVAAGTPNDVMMAPIVVNLDDDNCDGKVNEKDIPEIVFSTFTGGAYFKQGTLHAISLVGGQLVDKWTDPDIVQPGGGLAAGDLDGDGVPELIGCMNPGPAGASCCDALAQNTGAIAFRADGSTLPPAPPPREASSQPKDLGTEIFGQAHEVT